MKLDYYSMVNVKSFQLDLYDEGIPEVYVIAKKLSNHKIKIYKKCGMNYCKNQILNKPHCHYCPECMMDNFMRTTPISPLQAPKLLIRN